MKILLINPISSRKHPIKGRKAHFPVGLGLIAAYLKENGFNVDILDNETECLNKYKLSDYIRQSNHDIFGITGMSGNYSYTKGLSRIIKKLRNKPIILGGPLATYSYEAVLNNTDVDICVIGEGEETIVDLLENMNNLENVPGIAYKIKGNVKRNAPRNFKKSRDEYPFPDYESFHMEPYFKKLLVHYEGWGGRFFNKNQQEIKKLGIITGIGCPYRCAFCSQSVVKPRMRSIDNIISEIKHCKEKYDIDGVIFLDDLLIINEKRTLELCEKIKHLNVVWSGQARTNILNDRIAKIMKDVGCVGVGFGFESGSNTLLKAMRKQTTIENHKTAVHAAKKNELAIKVQLLFGFPGENKDTIEETISFFKEIEIPPRRFNILTPLPGSEVYDECLKKKIITNEDEYLTSLSTMDAGFGSKKVFVNLTKMSDDEFETLLRYAEKTMEDNYKRIFKKQNNLWLLEIGKYHLFRKLRRIKKTVSIKAWKRKIKSLAQKMPEQNLERNQIEEMYFNL